MLYSKIDLTGDGDYLTIGETWFLHRRRKNMNQIEFAEKLGWSVRYVKRLEADQTPMPQSGIAKEQLPAHERATIYRRRTNTTQAEIAATLGCSRAWVNKMEKGLVSADRLIEYWEV